MLFGVLRPGDSISLGSRALTYIGIYLILLSIYRTGLCFKHIGRPLIFYESKNLFGEAKVNFRTF
jgi:hypothetical protein